jgi:hypothetical protein
MDHSLAKDIFLEIQARPYTCLPESTEETCNNCFCKGRELIQRLAILGYTVRGRVAETTWNTDTIPKEISDLLPNDILVTHFFAEIYQDGEWRIIDPSFQPSLEKHGLTIGAWNNGKSCFPLIKIYTQEESIAYQKMWFDPEYQKDFFERGGACWNALNKWFSEIA